MGAVHIVANPPQPQGNNNSRNSKRTGLAARILKRGREERLAQASGGLAFTTVLSLVPLLAVSFALFARIPALHATGEAIREYLLRGLLPAEITKTMVKYLAQFTANASSLTLLGFGALLASAFALLLSVENTLNRIWQVKKPRAWLRRLLLYLAMLAVGPVLIGASLWATSSLLAASAALLDARPPWLTQALTLGPALLGVAGFTCLFRYVPHTRVRWRDALAAGLLAGIAFEFGKRGFALYLANVPAYRTIYGAFAPLLAFLVWVYYSWFITLGAALVSANLGRAGARGRQR